MTIESISQLEHSHEFKSWREQNSQAYLTHAFIMVDELNKNIWQIGFYDDKKDMITTFIVLDGKVEGMPETEKVFKEDGKPVQALDLSKAKVEFEKAQKIAEEIKKEHYASSNALKRIFILQNIENFGNVWNITFITADFKTINIKINAENGKVLSHKLVNIIEFEKGERHKQS